MEPHATTWAIFQCVYGANTGKPTRLLSNNPGIRSARWPKFDKEGRYGGPLPSKCPHKQHYEVFISKDEMVNGGQLRQVCASTGHHLWPPSFGVGHLATRMNPLPPRGDKMQKMSRCLLYLMVTPRNWIPMSGEEKGDYGWLGLCSPNRWPPDC